MSQPVIITQKTSSGWRVRRTIQAIASGILRFNTSTKQLEAATTLDGLTLTSPTVTGGTFTSPTITGSQSAAAGSAGGGFSLMNQKVAADNTNAGLFRVSIPNAIHGAGVELFITGAQGDGDSSDSKQYNISFSRIAGAASLGVISSAIGDAATVGTSTAVVTASLTSVAGGNTVTQTFDIQAKLARSAGASTSHVLTAQVRLINANASGITIAAL